MVGAWPAAGGGHSPARGCARLPLEFQYKQGPRLDRRVFPFFRRSTLPGPELALGEPWYGSQEAEARSCAPVGALGDPATGWRERAERSPGAARALLRHGARCPVRPGAAGDPWPASAGEARDLGVPAPAASVPQAAALPTGAGLNHGDPGIWGRRVAPRPGQAFCLEILDL